MEEVSCKSKVSQVYQEVIDDVISNASELFSEDEIDEQVLINLKQTWETKLRNVQNAKNAANKSGICVTPEFVSKECPQPVSQSVQDLLQVQAKPRVSNLTRNMLVSIQISVPGSNTDVLKLQVPASILQNNQLQEILTVSLVTEVMKLPQPIASIILQQHVNSILQSREDQPTKPKNANNSQFVNNELLK